VNGGIAPEIIKNTHRKGTWRNGCTKRTMNYNSLFMQCTLMSLSNNPSLCRKRAPSFLLFAALYSCKANRRSNKIMNSTLKQEQQG